MGLHSLRIKLRDHHLSDLSPDFREQLRDGLACQGMQMVATHVREGCVELHLELLHMPCAAPRQAQQQQQLQGNVSGQGVAGGHAQYSAGGHDSQALLSKVMAVVQEVLGTAGQHDQHHHHHQPAKPGTLAREGFIPLCVMAAEPRVLHARRSSNSAPDSGQTAAPAAAAPLPGAGHAASNGMAVAGADSGAAQHAMAAATALHVTFQRPASGNAGAADAPPLELQVHSLDTCITPLQSVRVGGVSLGPTAGASDGVKLQLPAAALQPGLLRISAAAPGRLPHAYCSVAVLDDLAAVSELQHALGQAHAIAAAAVEAAAGGGDRALAASATAAEDRLRQQAEGWVSDLGLFVWEVAQLQARHDPCRAAVAQPQPQPQPPQELQRIWDLGLHLLRHALTAGWPATAQHLVRQLQALKAVAAPARADGPAQQPQQLLLRLGRGHLAKCVAGRQHKVSGQPAARRRAID